MIRMYMFVSMKIPVIYIGICVPVNNTLSLRCSDVYMLHAMILCENVVISPVLF